MAVTVTKLKYLGESLLGHNFLNERKGRVVMKRFAALLFLALFLLAGPLVPSPALALTTTRTALLSSEISSIASDGTYNYLGTNTGAIYKQTISTGAVAATAIASVPGRITNLTLNGTTLYVTVADGAVYTVAAASSGLSDGMVFLGANDASTTGATYTKTRAATGSWYLAKTAGSDNSYLSFDITSLMRTMTSKGLKLTSIKILSGVSTQVLDNNFVYLSKTTYADNTAPSVSNITVSGAQQTIAAGTAGQPLVGTVTVTTPAWQNTSLARWAVDIWINSSTQASAVYRFYGMFLYFTEDYQ
mgnify:CR=1 FL=1